MCAISMCVAKSQRTKGAQKYAPDGDVPGKRSRNFVTNIPVQRHLKEIDFGNGQKKKGTCVTIFAAPSSRRQTCIINNQSFW